MRATMSKDGVVRANIQVKARIGYDELVGITALYLNRQVDERDGEPGRGILEAFLRQIILDEGVTHVQMWREHVDEYDVTDLHAIAKRIVALHWPDFPPTT